MSREHEKEDPVQDERSRIEKIRLVASTALGILWVTTPPLFGFWILAEIGLIGDWLLSMGGPTIGASGVPLLGLALYSLLFMACSGVGVLPTYAQAILGGWIFGFWLGTPAALLGFTGGAGIGSSRCIVE